MNWAVFNTSALSAGQRSIDEHHARSRTRFEPREFPAPAAREEILVVDERFELRPSQVIEGKLNHLLRASSLPVSFLLTRGIRRSR